MQIRTSSNFEVIAFTRLLNSLIPYALDNGYSIAVWQLPGDSDKHVLLSKKSRKIKRTELEELPTGFVFAPFDRKEDPIFLDADYLFSFTSDHLSPAKNRIEEKSSELVGEILSYTPSEPKRFYKSQVPIATSLTHERFIALVERSVSEIEKGELEKVVPSRSRSVSLPTNFDLVLGFEKLCGKFPNALVSFVSTPESGSWLGATPELLVSVKDSIFKTVALAGTQPFIEGANLKSVAWTQKEIEEQALVERYIISCFKKIRLREYDELGPKTVVAGNLMHLRSDFTVDMKETNFPQLGSVMLQLLHPTSAVCGAPLEKAEKFLKENEGYDRAFYAGYLGPVNVREQINIFVNLRCMQLHDNLAVVYAGAGVTSDSIPEKEWEETEMKMNTLLRVLIG